MPENAGRYHDAAYTLDEKIELPDDVEEQPLSAGHDEADAEAVRERIEEHKETAKQALEDEEERRREFAERDPKPTPSELLRESGREPTPDEDDEGSKRSKASKSKKDSKDSKDSKDKD